MSVANQGVAVPSPGTEEVIEVDITETPTDPNSQVPPSVVDENGVPINNRMKEIARKQEKLEASIKNINNAGTQKPQEQQLSQEQLDEIMLKSAKEEGWINNDTGEVDVEGYVRSAKLFGKMTQLQQSNFQTTINALQNEINELKLGANNKDYVELQTEINDVIENSEVLKSLKGKISNTEMKKLALERIKSSNTAAPPTSKTRVVSGRPPVDSTVSSRTKSNKVSLTPFDLQQIRNLNMDTPEGRKEYAKMKAQG